MSGAVHLFGFPLFPRLIRGNETSVYGGFRKKPVQVLVEDNVDDVEDINVYLKVDDKIDTKLKYNKRTGYYETSWTGLGWNIFTMDFTAIDRTGNKAMISQEISYHCVYPLLN